MENEEIKRKIIEMLSYCIQEKFDDDSETEITVEDIKKVLKLNHIYGIIHDSTYQKSRGIEK